MPALLSDPLSFIGGVLRSSAASWHRAAPRSAPRHLSPASCTLARGDIRPPLRMKDGPRRSLSKLWMSCNRGVPGEPVINQAPSLPEKKKTKTQTKQREQRILLLWSPERKCHWKKKKQCKQQSLTKQQLYIFRASSDKSHSACRTAGEKGHQKPENGMWMW